MPNFNKIDRFSLPDERGRFGPYGGSYVPETLSHPLSELTAAYLKAKQDPAFQEELAFLLRTFAGRPTELYFAERLTKEIKVASIPISVFYETPPEDKILRFCFAKTDEMLLEAASRLREL